IAPARWGKSRLTSFGTGLVRSLRAAAAKRAVTRSMEVRSPDTTRIAAAQHIAPPMIPRSEEHTSELQSLMRHSYAVFCLQKQKQYIVHMHQIHTSRDPN